MTVGEEPIPPDFDDLNGQFYQEDGPSGPSRILLGRHVLV